MQWGLEMLRRMDFQIGCLQNFPCHVKCMSATGVTSQNDMCRPPQLNSSKFYDWHAATIIFIYFVTLLDSERVLRVASFATLHTLKSTKYCFLKAWQRKLWLNIAMAGVRKSHVKNGFMTSSIFFNVQRHDLRRRHSIQQTTDFFQALQFSYSWCWAVFLETTKQSSHATETLWYSCLMIMSVGDPK